MAALTDTRFTVENEPDWKEVSFQADVGLVEFVDMGDEPTVQIGFEPVSVAEAASTLGDVADDIGTEAVQVACGILADIDEESMFEFLEPSEPDPDKVVLANGDDILVLEGEEAEAFRRQNE